MGPDAVQRDAQLTGEVRTVEVAVEETEHLQLAFAVQLALSGFSTSYATDQGLRVCRHGDRRLPPLVLFLVLRRDFIQGLPAGTSHR
jgi:hypothetical protein